MVTTQGDGGASASEADAEREARQRRLRRAVRDRMLQLGLTQKELGERAGLSKSGVGRLLSGEREPRLVTLERLAAALGVPVGALVDPAPGAVDSGATRTDLTPGALSAGGGASLHYPGQAAGAAPDPVGAGAGAAVAVYAGYPLWGRVDPRTPGPPGAGGRVRRVMREAGGGLGGPEDVFAVLVEDEGLAEIETAAGRVRAGWRLFVDRRTAAGARPGAIVAAMSATGRLVVGALERHPGRPDDAWTVHTGRYREGLAREDVLGEVVEYQPPAAAIGHIRTGAPAEATYFVAAEGPPAPERRAG